MRREVVQTALRYGRGRWRRSRGLWPSGARAWCQRWLPCRCSRSFAGSGCAAASSAALGEAAGRSRSTVGRCDRRERLLIYVVQAGPRAWAHLRARFQVPWAQNRVLALRSHQSGHWRGPWCEPWRQTRGGREGAPVTLAFSRRAPRVAARRQPPRHAPGPTRQAHAPARESPDPRAPARRRAAARAA